jgi:hypothetical protein
LRYVGKYDDLYFERVKTIAVESGYSDVSVEGLSQTGKFVMRYGDLRVGNITAGFSRIDVITSYTDVDLGFVPGASFSLDANVNYCDINHSGLKVTEIIERSSNTTLKASKGSGGGQVMVRMNYGDFHIH